MTKVCSTCGASPCYLICPAQDRYQGDSYTEHCDHEAGAMYDDTHERWAGEAISEPCSDSEDGYVRVAYVAAPSSYVASPADDDNIPF